MNARDDFWDSLPETEDGEIEWPAEARARRELANDIVGAVFTGALDHVLQSNLAAVGRQGPKPGCEDYSAKLARAEALATLSPEQREAVEAIVRDVSQSSAYWALVKLGNVANDLSVELVVRRTDDDGEVVESFVLNDVLDLHQIFLDWQARFS